jgi:pilus assembly protein CpaE
MLTAAVASADVRSSGSLRACLEQTGLVYSVLEWTVSPEHHPGPGGVVPDIVVLDFAGGLDAAFAFASHLRRLRPTVCIIACSPSKQPTPELLIKAMRSGIQEFLPQPVDPGALKEALARYVETRGEADSGEVEKVIVVMGSKGGVGTTTVAVNLGVQLAQEGKQSVTLLDLARPLGHVGLLLDLQCRFTVRDAIENLERLDGHFLGGLLTRHKSGLEVLAGTSTPDEWQHIPVPGLTRVVNVAQSRSDSVVVDLGTVYSSEWSSVLHLARNIVLVAEANVPALWTLERHISTISSFGLDPERFRIMINRWHRTDEEALKAFEKKIRRPIFARLPNDFRQVSEAINLGMPLSKNHNDPLVVKFRQVACELAGISPAAGAKRGTIFNLFSPPSSK